MWLETFIALDLGFKFCVALILLLRYFELETRQHLFWMAGWFLFTLFVFLELAGIRSSSNLISFTSLMCWGLISVPFLFSMDAINKKPKRFKAVLIVSIISALVVSIYFGLYIKHSFFAAAFIASVINGAGFIISALLFLQEARQKHTLARRLIFFAMVINGVHNLDYPFLRTNLQLAKLGFILCSIFSAIFAAGLVIKSHNDIVEKIREKTTELEDTQLRLVQSERMAVIGQMAAIISHELRNPLAGIKTAAYFLRKRVSSQKTELQKAIEDLELEMKYAENIITNVLTFAKPPMPIFVLADVNKIINESLDLATKQGLLHNIELDRKFMMNLPEILLDAGQVKQAIMNLLINAVQAMPEGGKIMIATRKQDKNIKIDVSDTGCGISPELLDKLFNPFFTTKSRGTGLGLAITKEVVERHGGYVDVTSRLGEGTTFILSLPISKEQRS